MATVLVIEAEMAGMVIGRGGSKIKSIQSDSGAVVKLTNGDTEDTRKIKITGTEDARRAACDLIELTTGKVLRKETTTAVPLPPARKTQIRRPRRDDSPPERITLTAEDLAELDSFNEERNRKLLESLVPIEKDFYVEHEDVRSMSNEDVEIFRLNKNQIMVSYIDVADHTRPIPKPIKTFENAFYQYPKIMNVIKKQKFTDPSPIQCQAWPILLSGHDLISIAQTGTGKTLAYILPALIHLTLQPVPREQRIGPSVLILVPTRELVLQIEEEIKKYIFDGIKVLSVYGGVELMTQIQPLLDWKPDIVVATPGRLNELVSVQAVKLRHVSYMVLDEADRMLDMGFKNQIELALSDVRPDRQTVLTSATWPISVQQLAKNYATNPLHITIGSLDLTTVNTVQQKIIVLKENQKEAWLENFISKDMSKSDKIIIFMRKKVYVDKLYEKMRAQNIECRCIHGGRIQIEREASLADMRNGVVSILIATDVASRGLDIHDISLVINYDFPLNIEEYVHRVGRTGRAGKTGSAITLFSYKDKSSAPALISILEKSNQLIPKELYNMLQS